MTNQPNDGAFRSVQDKKSAVGERDARHEQVIELHKAGRYAEALALLERQFAEIEGEAAPARTRYFMPMFQLELLLEHYAPARAAMVALRDAQAARLLAGDLYCGTDPAPVKNAFYRVERFSLVVQMNETLKDVRSTYDVFRQIEAQRPDLARAYAWSALAAMVEVGDFALANRYRREPLSLLQAVNAGARDLPLFPPPRQAPRLAADLTNLVTDVRISMAVLRGLGDSNGSDTLRDALLSGLVSTELKELARRELDEPGTITRAVVEHQMAEEDRARAL